MIRTERLILRPWIDDDLEPYSRLNADPEVMRYFPSTLDRRQSDALAGRIRRFLDERGYGLWAVEVVGRSRFIGFTGLWEPSFQAHFTPCTEVGWRLARQHWGNGYATEAAWAAIRYGFERLGLREVVSMTSVGNRRSRRVMEKLGMTRDPAEDFEHPKLPPGHPLRPHVLYRLKAERFLRAGRPRDPETEGPG